MQKTSHLPRNVLDEARKLEADFPNDPVAVFDNSGKYRYASTRHEKLLGYRADELTGGMSWRDLVVQADQRHMDITWSDAELNGESIDISVVVRTRGGDEVKLRGNSRQVVCADGTHYWITRSWRLP